MERVLVAVDDSEGARAAVEYALEHFPNATIHAVHVPESDNFTLDLDSTVIDEVEEEARTVLEQAAAIADEYGRAIETELVFGNPAKGIVSYADDHDVDQIVVGSRGRDGATRVLLGSVAETVVRRANCPVTVVR